MKKKKPRRIAELNEIKNSSDEIYLNLLGYKPEQTSLQKISENEWNEFAIQRGLNPNSSGIYLPRNQTAFVRDENPLSLFHEYFGHGLYCEQSLSGRRLVELEKRLLEEEKQEFSSKEFSLEDLKKFRKENQTFNYLENFKNNNLATYEGFAVFSEYFLSREFGLENVFENKYETLNGEFGNYFDSVVSFNKKFGDLATFYGFGMARRTEPKRVKKLLEDIYGDKLKYVQFALIYGSKKEFSDIDVFMVGKNLEDLQNEWIDVRNYSKGNFEKKMGLLDLEVTDPLFSGEIIFGDKNYFEVCKNKILNQDVNEDIINHNFYRSDEQLNLALKLEKNNPLRSNGLLYSATYIRNALALREGKKLLTKKNLISDSCNEKFIGLRTDNNVSDNSVFTELKGGKK